MRTFVVALALCLAVGVRAAAAQDSVPNAVLKAVIRTKGARGLFYDTRELLRVIRSTFNPVTRTA